MPEQRTREEFGAEELAIAVSHFDIGPIRTIEAFPRGSRRAPKAVIEAARGKFLFKRRARGTDDLAKIAFTHQIQLSLAAQSFPLPHLLGTRDDNNSMLVIEPHIYEMFEYIDGDSYDGSLDATFHSGRTLGLYHKLLRDFHGDYEPPTGSYHDAEGVRRAIRNTVGSLPFNSRPAAEVLTEVVDALEEAYGSCAATAAEVGMGDWPRQIVHGDWHPGNMLFRERRVMAVIDYDAARLQQRVIDLANGALQFSIVGGGDDPAQWPDHIDRNRFKRFMMGYDDVNVISRLELRVAPMLMCEAMIAEAVLPIAATGSFGRIPGFPFLEMVRRKVNWLLGNADELSAILKA